MNLTPEQQNERAALLADMDKMRERVEQFFKPAPEDLKPWPQVGDSVLFVNLYGAIECETCRDIKFCNYLLSIGCLYRPENRAYAERHLEALKVQAELRRMPGVCGYSEGHYGISLKHGCNELFATRSNLPHAAIGGVWFKTRTQASNAIDKLGARRLQLWIDDYVNAPIGGDV